MNARWIKNSRYAKNNDRYFDLECSCGKNESVMVNTYDYNYIEFVKKASPVCGRCQTPYLVDLYNDYFFNEKERTQTLLDLEFYRVDKRQRRVEKAGALKYDLIEHKLWIEADGEMVEMQDKIQAKKIVKNLVEKKHKYYLLQMIQEAIGGKEKKKFFEHVFSSSITAGEKLYHFVHSLQVQVMINAGYGEWGSLLFTQAILESDGTNPYQITEIAKPLLKELKQHNMNRKVLQLFQRVSKKYDHQDLKAGIEILHNEGGGIRNSFIELAVNEKFPSFQKYARYVFVEAKHRQGITDPQEVVRLLKDSFHMAKEMGVDYEILPKSLKIMHDVLTMNYNIARTEIEQKKFQEVVKDEKYKKLEYENEQFKVISPQNGDDLIKEGKSLSHCVASYYDRVVEKKSKIYFLRDSQTPEKSLVTIEVCGEKVHQAAGRSNRRPSEEERTFIVEWAKEKGLKYA